MTIIAPIKVYTMFFVEVHKDMDTNSDIEVISSFTEYEKALGYYKKILEKTKGECYVALELEINKEYAEEDCYSCERLILADNYVDDIKNGTVLF